MKGLGTDEMDTARVTEHQDVRDVWGREGLRYGVAAGTGSCMPMHP